MHKLLKPLRYVFYRILVWKSRDRRESTPVLVAALATVLLLFFNVLATTMVVNGFRGKSLLPEFPGGRGGLAVVLLLCFALGYNTMKSAWVDNNRYHELEREFQPIASGIGYYRDILFWTYLVASLLLPFLLSLLWHQRH